MNLKNILRASLFTPGINGRWGLPLDIEGPPGTAKTSLIYEVARDAGFHVEVLIGSIRQPSDILGIPWPTEEGITYPPDTWVRRVLAAVHALVFVDELTTCPSTVQAAFLRLILEGVSGDVVLPSTVRFFAAQNAVEDAAGGQPLSSAMGNRFGHVDFDGPGAAAWTEYIMDLDTPSQVTEVPNPAVTEAGIMAKWPEVFAMTRGLIAGYMHANPTAIYNKPPAHDPAASKAWPSYRSWECALRAHAGAEVNGLSDVERETFVSAFIGEAAGIELFTYLSEVDLPAPRDVLDGRVAFRHDPARLDISFAVLSACVSYLTTATGAAEVAKKEKRAVALWGVLGEVAEDAADLVTSHVNKLARASLARSPEAIDVLASINDVLVAADTRSAS